MNGNKVTTSIGTLEFHDGAPTTATAQKVYDKTRSASAVTALLQ